MSKKRAASAQVVARQVVAFGIVQHAVQVRHLTAKVEAEVHGVAFLPGLGINYLQGKETGGHVGSGGCLPVGRSPIVRNQRGALVDLHRDGGEGEVDVALALDSGLFFRAGIVVDGEEACEHVDRVGVVLKS